MSGGVPATSRFSWMQSGAPDRGALHRQVRSRSTEADVDTPMDTPCPSCIPKTEPRTGTKPLRGLFFHPKWAIEEFTYGALRVTRRGAQLYLGPHAYQVPETTLEVCAKTLTSRATRTSRSFFDPKTNIRAHATHILCARMDTTPSSPPCV